ncbi:hypothetical protein S40288_10637 [Stachybotrys chartarum IBT 40288]|nr:hypothetical protein S40288_10637 [Stachybotrys chartarum IBT 40288]
MGLLEYSWARQWFIHDAPFVTSESPVSLDESLPIDPPPPSSSLYVVLGRLQLREAAACFLRVPVCSAWAYWLRVELTWRHIKPAGAGLTNDLNNASEVRHGTLHPEPKIFVVSSPVAKIKPPFSWGPTGAQSLDVFYRQEVLDTNGFLYSWLSRSGKARDATFTEFVHHP